MAEDTPTLAAAREEHKDKAFELWTRDGATLLATDSKQFWLVNSNPITVREVDSSDEEHVDSFEDAWTWLLDKGTIDRISVVY